MEKNILVPIDHSEVSAKVVAIANHWAQRTGAKVVFLSVGMPISQETVFYSRFNTLDQDEGKQILEAFIQKQGLKANYEVRYEIGTPYQVIMDVEREINADLIIMGAHNHGFLDRLFLGSNTNYAFHHSKCSLYIYKKPPKGLENVILLPIDFTKVNHSVIAMADDWAGHIDARLHFIHVGPEPKDYHYNMEHDFSMDESEREEARAELKEKLNALVQECNVKSEYEQTVEFGKPYQRIADLQERIKANLIMIAAHSHTVLARWMAGSNTDYLLNHALCPMFIYKDKK